MSSRKPTDVFEHHQLQVARGTMRMLCTFTGIMGGMTHREAARIIQHATGKQLNVKGCTCAPSRATVDCYCPDSHDASCDCRRRPVNA